MTGAGRWVDADTIVRAGLENGPLLGGLSMRVWG